MLAYLNRNMTTPQAITVENEMPPEDAIWIDLLAPSKIEEDQVEQYLGLNIPTRAEMVEIESSSRLYKEDNALFMTALMLAHSDSPEPKLDPVTFVLTQKQLITIRYIESQSFNLFISKVKKNQITYSDPEFLLIELLDATIDRLADILELVGSKLDQCSKTIFTPNTKGKLDYQQVMQKIGANGDLNTKVRESLVTFNRLISFYEKTAHSRIDEEGKLQLITLSTDVVSLSDHANFLSTKVNFLLDATLGMVNIEQSNIIKLFSVAAVIFLPPTLVASVYGMNFHFMPELSWKYGYLFALCLMLTAAWLPYRYFKYRKWL